MTTSDEPRKATEVILDIESKLEHLTDIMMAVDLTIRTMSNKLNTLEQIVIQLSTIKAAPIGPAISSANTVITPKILTPQGFPQMPSHVDARNIPISAEDALPQTNSPEGFRRTSRPETYTNVKSEPKLANATAEAVALKPISKPGPVPAKTQFLEKQMPETKPLMIQNQIPVMQRVVDKTGKSIFLASVIVVDMDTGAETVKTKTNPIGHWSATLPVGTYKVSIKKEAGIGKDKVEAMQDLRVTSDQSKIDLPMLIIK